MIEKILLVDDDMQTNIYHRIILEESGLIKGIVDCLGVDQAMALLRSEETPPDIIFLDINMPMKTGWDFLEEYKELEATRRAKQVIILSTTRIPADLERAKKNAWVSKFFLKPLTVENIERLIEEMG